MKTIARIALTMACATIVLAASWVAATYAQTYLMRRPLSGLVAPGSTLAEAAPPTSAVTDWPHEIICRHSSLPGRRYIFRMSSYNTLDSGDQYVEYIHAGGNQQLAWNWVDGTFCAACSEGNTAIKVGCYGVDMNSIISNALNGGLNADGSAATPISF